MSGLEEILYGIVVKINEYLSNYILVFLLIGVGLWYTIRTRFIQLRCFGEGMRRTFGNFKLKGFKHDSGMSSFQALATAIAAQVGTGNIVGSSGAILTGGPGAIFWMWIIAFFGMATIYAEATLAVKTRVKAADGSIHGGPVYYITTAFKGGFGKFLAGFFAVAIILALGFMGCMVQSNSIGSTFETAFGIPSWIVGVVLVVICAFIFLGGTKRLASVTEKLVPLMAAIFILGGLVVLAVRIRFIPETFGLIFRYAFQPQAIIGGGFGWALKTAITQGAKRGLFSNEAGMGSVPNAAATADASHPVKQGLVQSLGVYVDTMLVCTSSAMIVLLTPGWETSGLTGIELAQHALTTQLGTWTNTFMSVLVLFFAFSSVIGNYFYAEVNMDFISRRPWAVWLYRLMVVGMVYFGSVASLGLVWNLADLFMALMALTNLVAIFLLGRFAFAALKDYFDQKARGIRAPEFDPKVLPSQKGILAWPRRKEEEIAQD